MALSLIPLHKSPKHYVNECCRLLNDEWKRSDTARLRSLNCSTDQLPTCLILIDAQNETLIGHLKLSRIPTMRTDPDASRCCFVESVVIDRKLRGKGYGTILMQKSEEYCKDVLHLKTIYLSTMGQEQFYRKLGYIECQPISIYGGNYTAPPSSTNHINNKINILTKYDCCYDIEGVEKTPMVPAPPLSILPPPPPPPPTDNNKNHTSLMTKKLFMKKDLF